MFVFSDWQLLRGTSAAQSNLQTLLDFLAFGASSPMRASKKFARPRQMRRRRLS
jgi:hypothetical protein